MNEETNNVFKQTEELAHMPYDELKSLWRTLYGNEPPTYTPAYIINRLAYRIQEFTFGGLSESARDKMRQMLAEHGYDKTGVKVQTPGMRKHRRSTDEMPILGTKLVREWKGGRYEIMILPHGVEYQGKRYRSLSAVAQIITGSHWNGRVFFGIESRSAADEKNTNTDSSCVTNYQVWRVLSQVDRRRPRSLSFLKTSALTKTEQLLL